MANRVNDKILDMQALAQICAKAALDKKASNLVILDVAKLTSYADYFVICESGSDRQSQAIARSVEEAVKKAGYSILGIEGLEQGAWVLIDMGGVIFHCFTESAKSYYNLEAFWGRAPKIDLR